MSGSEMSAPAAAVSRASSASLPLRLTASSSISTHFKLSNKSSSFFVVRAQIHDSSTGFNVSGFSVSKSFGWSLRKPYHRRDYYLRSLLVLQSRDISRQVVSFHMPTLEGTFVDRRNYHLSPICGAMNNRKGFGPTPKKPKKGSKSKPVFEDDAEELEEKEEDRDGGVIPEAVTNRMMKRMGFSVGIPLFIGLMFFPFFYYLKVILKLDVPNWVPFIVSFFFFGSAFLGVSYGIVSSSWDPFREGSLLGWNEAQRNWPVFWQSFWGKSGKK